MNFPHFEPQSAVLKEFIDFFYFLKTDYENPVQFFAFPHYHKPLNIHRAINYNIATSEISVEGISDFKPQMLLQGVYVEPILVRFSGKIDKLTIIFKDGALNNFMPQDFGNIALNHTQIFEVWEHLPQYSKFINDFFNCTDAQTQLQHLETFLLSILNVRTDWIRYQKAALLLKDMDAAFKITEIAKQVHLSERSLNRLVQKYNGMSPNSFKKIAQFRHSLQTKLVADNFHSLTDIAYSSNYYDASYFNKIYKSLTRKSPKAFFKNVDLYCNNKMVFEWH